MKTFMEGIKLLEKKVEELERKVKKLEKNEFEKLKPYKAEVQNENNNYS